jgi:lysophospholipase
LSYLLGKNYSPSECRKLISKNIRGELSYVSKKKQFSIHSSTNGAVGGVLSLLAASSLKDQPLDRALLPMLLCHAARIGDIPDLESIFQLYGTEIVNIMDADRSPLSVSCREGNVECVEYLLMKGASVHLRDESGRGPVRHLPNTAGLACIGRET